MKPRILVYINSHAGHYLADAKMKKHVSMSLGHKQWKFFGDIIIPNLIKDNPSYLTENFFHGVSAHQHTMIQGGGTFINPMMYGLHNDFSLWNDVIHENPEFYQEIIYIDVPYGIYENVAKDDLYFVDEEVYNDMSNIINEMVDKMRITYYATDAKVH